VSYAILIHFKITRAHLAFYLTILIHFQLNSSVHKDCRIFPIILFFTFLNRWTLTSSLHIYDLQGAIVFVFNGDARVYSRLSKNDYFEGNGPPGCQKSEIISDLIDSFGMEIRGYFIMRLFATCVTYMIRWGPTLIKNRYFEASLVI
jgi:hypothetical protein